MALYYASALDLATFFLSIRHFVILALDLYFRASAFTPRRLDLMYGGRERQ